MSRVFITLVAMLSSTVGCLAPTTAPRGVDWTRTWASDPESASARGAWGSSDPVKDSASIACWREPEDGRPERIYLKGTSEVNRVNFDMRSYRFVVSETVRLCLSVELVQWVP